MALLIQLPLAPTALGWLSLLVRVVKNDNDAPADEQWLNVWDPPPSEQGNARAVNAGAERGNAASWRDLGGAAFKPPA